MQLYICVGDGDRCLGKLWLLEESSPPEARIQFQSRTGQRSFRGDRMSDGDRTEGKGWISPIVGKKSDRTKRVSSAKTEISVIVTHPHDVPRLLFIF